jgi:hypothetical protein
MTPLPPRRLAVAFLDHVAEMNVDAKLDATLRLRAATSQVQKTPCAVGSGATLNRARMPAPRRVTGSNPLRSTRKSAKAAVLSVARLRRLP